MPIAIEALLQAKSARLADVGPGIGGPVLVKSDLTGTMQLYEIGTDFTMRPLTSLPEPVGRVRYVPGSEAILLEVDRGGDERFQIYRLEQGGDGPVDELSDLVALTAAPSYVHMLAGVSPDGQHLAYLSNKANGVDFDLWCMDLDSASEELVFAGGGWCHPGSGFSPDGRWVSIVRSGQRPLDFDLLIVDMATGEARNVLAHPDEAAIVGAPAWISATECLFSANVGTDNSVVWRYDVSSGASERVADDPDWDTDVVDGTTSGPVCLVENRNGASRLRVLLAGSNARSGVEPVVDFEVPLPEPGIVQRHNIEPPRFSADGAKLYYTLSTPRRAGDVWVFDMASRRSTRLTDSPAPVSEEDLASPATAQIASFDGERVPAFIFRPAVLPADGRPPVVVVVHGGPEGQSVLGFDPVVQGLVAAGFGVVVPNVRGSTGYGKRYAALDDTVKRLDSVRDLASVHGALGDLGFDQGRAALWGGSYGGYMVLAGVAFQPDLWAAGVDIVGISDLVTFLEHTSAYRRAHREREYGSLATDRDFLASASPLRHADAIRAPLFIIHGRNDPRVPVREAEQLVAELSRRGVRCELVIYEDEGHGLARLANRLDAYPRALAFLTQVLAS